MKPLMKSHGGSPFDVTRPANGRWCVTTTVGRAPASASCASSAATCAAQMAGGVELAAVVVGPDDARGVVPAQPAPGAALVVGVREGGVELAVAQRVVVPAGDAAEDDAVDLDGRAADGVDAGARAGRRDVALVAGAARGRAGQGPQIVVAGDEHQVRRGRAAAPPAPPPASRASTTRPRRR